MAHLLSVVTSVFLWALWWGGDGDRVKHATVLPSVVWIADTLHLVTASLRDGQEKLEDIVHIFSCSLPPPNNQHNPDVVLQ